MPDSYSFFDYPPTRERTVPNWRLTGSEVIWDQNAPDEAPPADEAAFVPGDHTVDDVKSYVEANPDERQTVLEAELAGKDRVTLIDWLEAGS